MAEGGWGGEALSLVAHTSSNLPSSKQPACLPASLSPTLSPLPVLTFWGPPAPPAPSSGPPTSSAPLRQHPPPTLTQNSLAGVHQRRLLPPQVHPLLQHPSKQAEVGALPRLHPGLHSEGRNGRDVSGPGRPAWLDGQRMHHSQRLPPNPAAATESGSCPCEAQLSTAGSKRRRAQCAAHGTMRHSTAQHTTAQC